MSKSTREKLYRLASLIPVSALVCLLAYAFALAQPLDPETITKISQINKEAEELLNIGKQFSDHVILPVGRKVPKEGKYISLNAALSFGLDVPSEYKTLPKNLSPEDYYLYLPEVLKLYEKNFDSSNVPVNNASIVSLLTGIRRQLLEIEIEAREVNTRLQRIERHLDIKDN